MNGVKRGPDAGQSWQLSWGGCLSGLSPASSSTNKGDFLICVFIPPIFMEDGYKLFNKISGLGQFFRHIEGKYFEEGTPFSSWSYGSVATLLANAEFKFRSHILPLFKTKPVCCERAGGHCGWLGSAGHDSFRCTFTNAKVAEPCSFICILSGHRRGYQFCPHTWISDFPDFKAMIET